MGLIFAPFFNFFFLVVFDVLGFRCYGNKNNLLLLLFVILLIFLLEIVYF